MMKYKKGSFVVVPNKEHLSTLKATTQCLFFWICSYANDDGVCYPSRKKLAQNINTTVKTVDKHISILESLGFIQKTIRTDKNKINKSNLYQIMVLEEGVGKNLPQGREKNDPRGREKKDPLTISNKNYILSKDSNEGVFEEKQESDFNLVEEQKKLEDSPRRDLNIIALYIEERISSLEPKILNKEQYNLFLRRHLKPASDLKIYTNEQILGAIDGIKEKYPNIDWVLDTVLKELTK